MLRVAGIKRNCLARMELQLVQNNPYLCPGGFLPTDYAGAIRQCEQSSLFRRWLGSVIDVFLQAMLLLAGSAAVQLAAPQLFEKLGWWSRAVVMLASLLVFFVTHGYLLARYGQTIGKRLMGMRIVSYASHQRLPLWRLFTLREGFLYTVVLIPGVGPVIALIDALAIFITDHRCLHDLLAGSVVIDVERNDPAFVKAAV